MVLAVAHLGDTHCGLLRELPSIWKAKTLQRGLLEDSLPQIALKASDPEIRAGFASPPNR